MTKSTIYFNANKHKYTNEVGNTFISATTLIGKYEYKFEDKQVDIAKACERIGKNPRHPKYKQYRGKSWKLILADWAKTRDDACDLGNSKHDYLERSVKESSGFYKVFGNKYGSGSEVKLYTIEDILEDHAYGIVDLNKLKSIKKDYPRIYTILKTLVDEGFKLYSEIGVFCLESLISGLVDILAVREHQFLIVDWKTNKNPVRFESGYYEKDNNGNVTNYKLTEECFRSPLHLLPQSVGNKYTLQLSLYAYLIERFGLKWMGSILCHILHNNYPIDHPDVQRNPSWINKQQVDIIPIKYLKNEIVSMVADYELKRSKGQINMFK